MTLRQWFCRHEYERDPAAKAPEFGKFPRGNIAHVVRRRFLFAESWGVEWSTTCKKCGKKSCERVKY